MAIQHSETFFGKKLLDKFSGVLASRLGRTPVLNADVIFQLGRRTEIENLQYHAERVGKAMSEGLIPRSSATAEDQKDMLIGKTGGLDFIVFMRTGFDVDERHFNVSAINHGVPLALYDNDKKVHTLGATAIKLAYEVRYYGTTVGSINDFLKSWATWFSGDYALSFNIDLENPDGSVARIPISNQFEIDQSPSLESVSRYENSLYYTIGFNAELHTVAIKEIKEYTIQQANVNIYQETSDSNILIETMEITE